MFVDTVPDSTKGPDAFYSAVPKDLRLLFFLKKYFLYSNSEKENNLQVFTLLGEIYIAIQDYDIIL